MAVLSLLGAAYQVLGNWWDEHRFPQHRRSVQAGPLRLSIDCSGQGSPAVILDGGMGVPALGWLLVHPGVARFSRVCSYDRAGYGWSEVGPKPRTSLQIAKELKVLLDSSGEKGPYILVGHSFGGYNVRMFIALYPSDVAGIVLVDAEHGDEEKRIDALLPAAVNAEEEKHDRRADAVDRVLTPLSLHLGVERLMTTLGWGADRSLPRDFREELLYLQPRTDAAVSAEAKAESASWDEVRSAGNLGDRPLIVLTAGHPYLPDPLLTKEEMDREERVWINGLQAEEARLSTRGKQIVVADSGHMIPFERPDSVVSAIHGVWAASRQK